VTAARAQTRPDLKRRKIRAQDAPEKPGRPRLKPKLETRPQYATALMYAMAVINDNTVDALRRDAMAIQVLRYVEGASTSQPAGKKEERRQAALAAHERFAVPPAPVPERPQ
jgi:hypothetical protein